MKNDDLLMQIMMLDFAVQDSALFIDTHPCDKEAMNYFNEAATRLKAAKKEYQKQGHALVNREVGAYQNDYLSAPWPWVGDHKCGCTKNVCNIDQLGGPDGELGAALRYLSQRYTMPYPEIQALLTDIGTEELAHK